MRRLLRIESRGSVTRHAQGEKGSLPTLDNILNFNFELIFRYEGEKLLNSASKDERVKAQDLLAGILLLYLGGLGKGPIETFVWTKEAVEALAESGVLTQEEIQPLLDVCRLEYFDGPQLEEDRLTDEQKKRITTSAYKRFQLAKQQPPKAS